MDSGLTSCVLDDCVFSAGGLGTTRGDDHFVSLVSGLRVRGQLAVAAHACYVSGREEKRRAMNRTGVWLLRTNGSEGRRWRCEQPTGPLLV